MIIRKSYSGQFGNCILHYLNLVQLANILKQPFKTVGWRGSEYFEDITVENVDINGKIINNKYLLEHGVENLKDEDNIICGGPMLGELFYKLCIIDPNQILKIKQEYTAPVSNDHTTVAIHIRDFGGWKKEYELNEYYYINAVEFCLKESWDKSLKFYIFTNNLNYECYKKLISYFKLNNIQFELGESTKHNKSFIYDFSQISQCDVIISAFSTFSICAGFLGKKGKKIIHNSEWMKGAIERDDKFWIDLMNGGNEYYNLWKLISQNNK